MKRSLWTIAGIAMVASSQATIFGFAAPLINAAQEVGGSTSTAYGSGSFTVDDSNFQITGSVTVTNQPATSVTGFHIHQAPAGSNGPIIVFLDSMLVGGSPITAGNVVTYIFDGTITGDAAGKLAAMIAGDTYFNFHTAANPAGAIRGQIDCVVVPEPSAIAAMGIGALALIARRRRKA